MSTKLGKPELTSLEDDESVQNCSKSHLSKLQPLEFRVFQTLKQFGVGGARVVIGCSGGLDSVVLLSVLEAVARKLNITIVVAHVHHGNARDLEQSKARDEARERVRAEAKRLNLKFVAAEAPSELLLLSEEALRDFRHRELTRLAQESLCGFLALGHHADDLFETRLFRLIRGTGSQGLSAMNLVDEGSREVRLLRPLLNESREVIREYAAKNCLQWSDDPSNADSSFFRNWLRNEWLPQLEAKREGSLRSFSRSLETLLEELGEQPRLTKSDESSLGKISRLEFASLAPVRKRSLIANLTRSLGIRDFSQARVEEVIKRLHHLESTGQKLERFKVGGLEWSVTATEIEASEPSVN